ncbi:30495_t:CDS:2, partial [Gigaspora margarita]
MPPKTVEKNPILIVTRKRKTIIQKRDYIEKFKEETGLHLKYYNCEGKSWIISQIIEYFSYQYAISERINVDETESFAKYMIKNVKNIKTFDNYCQ